MNDGPRADDGEFAGDDIEELGQLVQAGLAEDPSDRRDARVVFQLEIGTPLGGEFRVVGQDLFQFLVRIGVHRAEFPHADVAAIPAETVGAVQDRPFAGKFDDESQDQEHRDQYDDADAGQNEFKNGFREAGDRPEQLVADLQAAELAEADRRPPCDGNADVVGHEQNPREMFHIIAHIGRNRLRRQTADDESGPGTGGDGGSIGQGAETVPDGGIVIDETDDPKPVMRIAADFRLELAAAFPRARDENGDLADVQPLEQFPDHKTGQRDEKDVQNGADDDHHARKGFHAPGESEIAEEQQIRHQHGVDPAAHFLHGVQGHPGTDETAVVKPHDRGQQNEYEQERPHGRVGGHLVTAAHGMIYLGRAEPAAGQRQHVRQDQKKDADASVSHCADSSRRNTRQIRSRPIGISSSGTGFQPSPGGVESSSGRPGPAT